MSAADARPGNLAHELALLGALAVLWGSSYLLIKIAVATIPPITLIAVRVSLAAGFLLVVMRYRRARFPKDWKLWGMLLVQAFFNSIASWTLLAWGQRHVDSGLAGVLNSTSPNFVFFLTALFTRHEPAMVWKLAGAVSGVVGVALLMGPQVLGEPGREAAGQLAVLASAVLYAAAAIHGKRFSSIPATVTAAGTMLWAAACLVPLSLIVDQPWTLRPSASSVLAAVTLGFLGTALALLIYFRLVRTLGSMGVASNSYLRAGVSVLLGVVVLGERVSAAIGIGFFAIILGVALINVSSPATKARRSLNRVP